MGEIIPYAGQETQLHLRSLGAPHSRSRRRVATRIPSSRGNAACDYRSEKILIVREKKYRQKIHAKDYGRIAFQ